MGDQGEQANPYRSAREIIAERRPEILQAGLDESATVWPESQRAYTTRIVRQVVGSIGIVGVILVAATALLSPDGRGTTLGMFLTWAAMIVAWLPARVFAHWKLVSVVRRACREAEDTEHDHQALPERTAQQALREQADRHEARSFVLWLIGVCMVVPFAVHFLAALALVCAPRAVNLADFELWRSDRWLLWSVLAIYPAYSVFAIMVVRSGRTLRRSTLRELGHIKRHDGWGVYTVTVAASLTCVVAVVLAKVALFTNEHADFALEELGRGLVWPIAIAVVSSLCIPPAFAFAQRAVKRERHALFASEVTVQLRTPCRDK